MTPPKKEICMQIFLDDRMRSMFVEYGMKIDKLMEEAFSLKSGVGKKLLKRGRYGA
jgi:hypothetical protein